MVLRDSYVIGSPAVGDNDFAAEFASYSNNPVDRQSTLWRIVNQFDIIPRIPPGYNNRIFGRFISKWDFFNYTHIGHEVKIPINHTHPLKMKPSSFQSPAKIRIIRGDEEDGDDIEYIDDKSLFSSASSYVTRHLYNHNKRNNENDNTDNDSVTNSLEIESLGIKSANDNGNNNNDDSDDNDSDNDGIDLYLNNTYNNHNDELIEKSQLFKLIKQIHKKAHQINEQLPLLNKSGSGGPSSFVNPIQVLEYFYPRLIHDHLPYEYYHGLERAKEFY